MKSCMSVSKQGSVGSLYRFSYFDGETSSQQYYKRWEIPQKRQSVGVAMSGDQYCVLIPGSADLPATAKQVFTTVHAGQSEVVFAICVGANPTASKNRVLGHISALGLTGSVPGQLQIEVTAHINQQRQLSVEARDLDSGCVSQWMAAGNALDPQDSTRSNR
eukprot:jgi/Botrbrau1/13712/Bobra.250_2s0009.2